MTLISDGAFSGKSRVGGWAAILLQGDRRLEVSGWEPDSTNNRMELMAVIMGLRELKRPSRVRIICDSKYVIDGSQIWIHNWLRQGWVNTVGEPVKNQTLWEELIPLLDLHDIEWIHVRGHRSHLEDATEYHHLNAEADKLAVNARLEGTELAHVARLDDN